MYWLRLVLFHIVPLILATAAPVLLLWAWGNGLPLLPALLVGLLFLSAAVIIYLAGALQQPSHAQADDIEALWAELTRLRQQVRQLSTASAEASPTSSQDLPEKKSQAAPATAHSEASSKVAAPPASSSASATPSSDADAPPAPPPDPAAFTTLQPPQGYALYMEAVHDAASGEAAFYRAMPALPAEEGRIYPARHAQIRARLLGNAGGLQLHMLRDSLTFLRELRARHTSLMVVCPVDAATLGQPQTAEAVMQTLRSENALAQEGLLLAVALNDLGVIGRAAREQLVALSEHVAGWVVDSGHVPDAQTPLPLPLHVRYVDVPVAALEQLAGFGNAAERLQALLARGWRVVAHGVDSDAQLLLVRQVGVLARGTVLAAPRRLRLPSAKDAMADAPAAQPADSGGMDSGMSAVVERRVAGMH